MRAIYGLNLNPWAQEGNMGRPNLIIAINRRGKRLGSDLPSEAEFARGPRKVSEGFRGRKTAL